MAQRKVSIVNVDSGGQLNKISLESSPTSLPHLWLRVRITDTIAKKYSHDHTHYETFCAPDPQA